MIPLGIRRRTGAGRRGLLADIDQRPTMNIIAEEICGIRWRLLQRDFSGRLLVVALRQKLGPDAARQRRVQRSAPSPNPPLQTHIAQNKRHHGGRQIEAPARPQAATQPRYCVCASTLPTPGRQRYPPRPPTAVSPADGSPRSRCAAGSYRRPAGEGNRVSIPGPIRPSPGSQGLSATPRRCCRPAAGAGDRDIPAVRGDARTNESINA